jgi:hypothetical protein
MMDGSHRAEFSNVEVLNANDVVMMCRVGVKVVGIPPRRMLPGTTLVPYVGATGTLVITKEMALNLGLL